jgi:hypothetical protein
MRPLGGSRRVRRGLAGERGKLRGEFPVSSCPRFLQQTAIRRGLESAPPVREMVALPPIVS